ncbi:MAG: RNA polymerase sigma-70 factor [Chitinophagales bacterium]|nr:RNA polymerase sigma-70 factor [Chitinophagales bacterium]
MHAKNEEEQQWLARLREGDEGALELIFERYYAYLLHIALQLTADRNTAKDMVQEVFLKFWNKRQELHIEIALKSYLQRAVVNRCISHLRRLKPHYDEAAIPPIPDKTANALQVLEAESLEWRIQEAIGRLPEQCALIFRLSRFEFLSYTQIAEQLGIAPKTVENQIGKALRLLREWLGPFLPELILCILFT